MSPTHCSFYPAQMELRQQPSGASAPSSPTSINRMGVALTKSTATAEPAHLFHSSMLTASCYLAALSRPRLAMGVCLSLASYIATLGLRGCGLRQATLPQVRT